MKIESFNKIAQEDDKMIKLDGFNNCVDWFANLLMGGSGVLYRLCL